MTPVDCSGGGVLCMVQLASVQCSGQQWAHMRVNCSAACVGQSCVWVWVWVWCIVVYCGVVSEVSPC